MDYLLYHLSEFQKAANMPAHLYSETALALSDLWDFGKTPYGRLFIASNEMLERVTRTFAKPAFGIEQVNRGETLLTIEEEPVITKTFCTLKRFNRFKQGKLIGQQDPKVLIVAPMAGHYATLLRDTVRVMAVWHETYITDWVNVRDVPLTKGEFSLDTYIDHLLEFMRFLGEDYHVLAVCQPAVPVLAAVSLLADAGESHQPKSMTLIGGPIDTRINPGQVNTFVSNHSLEWFRQALITTVPYYYPGGGRAVCPGFVMLTGFVSLHPERHQEAAMKLFEHLVEGDEESVNNHQKFYDEYRAVMDLDAPYFLDSMQVAFQEFHLPKGQMYWRKHLIKPQAICRTALMTVEGEKDDISPPGQTKAAHGLCSSIPENKKKHYLQAGVGHYGLFNGQRWRNFVQPKIAEFIRENHY